MPFGSDRQNLSPHMYHTNARLHFHEDHQRQEWTESKGHQLLS